MGFYAGTAEIFVTHNFGVRRPVRMTAVNLTAAKPAIQVRKIAGRNVSYNGTNKFSLMAP
ncbi:hypothetical protein ARAF_2977 [Arsenophonus endosymbiont of Aleurodicus floccissimus]|uniref:hypothetical protein n=1 Tax=Arsenophonus endosymbiont of Aleurodicus floccissimus TaxID=2152761 RepID=UPI000E6AEECC|nr:hypothetical protein [Arsenophonus endosymbiont of Aleurodicus floccissimus]SPP32636.1 hypothetical protein ARAF_2977 [Arsenophonus endosymbiont of Aleurodicus floccissimus]